MRSVIKLTLFGLVFFLLPLAHVLADDIIAEDGCAFHRAVIAANTDEEFQGCPAGNGADTIYMTKSIGLGGPLPITSDITIEGSGHTISGGGRNRIFHVEKYGRLTIRNLRLVDGGGEPAVLLRDRADHFGGAIFSRGTLEIANSEFDNNSGLDGGAIYQFGGELYIRNSTFRNNSASNCCGAILSLGETDISNSIFKGNSAGFFAGAIALGGDSIIRNSEFSGNTARESAGALHSWSHNEVRLAGNQFRNNSPDDCDGYISCASVPGGGPSGPVGIDASAAAPAPAPSDSADPAASRNIAHSDLFGIEHVACTADDIYFILRLKSDTPVREHLLEVFVSTDGSAVLADILPIPKHSSLPDRLLSVVSLSLVGEGVNVVTGFPLAGSVFHAGAELTEWIDEQFTRSSSPLHFRLTWYNTDAHPGIERYLVHATRSGAGNLRVASRLAPLSEAASWANRVREQDTYSTLLKDTIDLAVYWMGGDPGGPGLENDRADAAVDIIARPLEWVADTVLNEPVAYFAERFFTEEGVAAEPVQVC